jgi:hypothetical protein
MKIYSYLTHDDNKRKIVDEMVGNVKELNDPANAYDRVNQYPHAVTPAVLPSTLADRRRTPEPSIRSRQLVIPLHFWFCENPGSGSAAHFAAELGGLYQRDAAFAERSVHCHRREPDKPHLWKARGSRELPDVTVSVSAAYHRSSEQPVESCHGSPDPYVEGNFIWMTEAEKNQLARADQTFLVKTVQFVSREDGQFGANTDMELPMFNLVTRFVFAVQRSDRILVNDWDNYTNWENPTRAPWTAIDTNVMSGLDIAGQQQDHLGISQVSGSGWTCASGWQGALPDQDVPVLQSAADVPAHDRHYDRASWRLNRYSFALDNDQYQPSGSINGSMFNKIVLRLSLQHRSYSAAVCPRQQLSMLCKVVRSSVRIRHSSQRRSAR